MCNDFTYTEPSARCGLQKQLSDSCPGERGAMSVTRDHNMQLMTTPIGQIAMTTATMYSTGRDLCSQRWGEHFQDLSGWCQPNKPVDMLVPRLDEQLNTPIISAQDEFDFGVRSSDERFGMVMPDMECDPWEVTSSLTSANSLTTNTIPHTQKELWDSVDVWLSSNSPEHNPEFEEIISPPPQQPTPLEFNKKHIVKANGDFLLSQSPVKYHQIKTEESCINFSPYLNTTSSPEDNFSETNNNDNISNNNNNYVELAPYVKGKPVIKQLVTPLIKDESNTTTVCNPIFNKQFKRECSFDLSSLLKSEEPFINDMDTEHACSLSPVCKVSSPIVISDKEDDVIAAEEVVVTTEDSHLVKQEDYIATTSPLSYGRPVTSPPLSYGRITVSPLPYGKSVSPLSLQRTIKTEMDHSSSLTYKNNTSLRKHSNEVSKQSPQPLQETAKNTARPKLKLDIDAALMSTQSDSLDTPEVLRPLVDGIDGFNLLSYVCDDGAINLLSTPTPPNSSVCDQAAGSSSMTMAIAPHQEKKRGVGRPPGRYQPKAGKKGRKIIKEETAGEEELPKPLEELTPSGRPKRKSAESFKSNIKQRRLTSDTDDLESLSSFDTGVNSDSDESFSTRSRPSRKRKLSKSSSKSSSTSRRRKTSDSDLDSVFSSSDRYRELRDRNNEASRRSRLNRKSREYEMREQAVQLEKDNRLLKLKAEEMERLVKKLRENLMQLVLNR